MSGSDGDVGLPRDRLAYADVDRVEVCREGWECMARIYAEGDREMVTLVGLGET